MEPAGVAPNRPTTADTFAPQRPEFRLLLACAIAESDPHTRREIEDLLNGPLEWNYLLNMGRWHGMLPLLADRLVGATTGVPAEVSQFLRDYSSDNARSNLRLAAELLNISTAFEAGGIPHIPYKGVVLGEYLYGTVASRAAGDIDLIVKPEDASNAVACLRSLGFEDTYSLTAAQLAASMRSGIEHSFIRDGVTVDLHWRMVQDYVWPSLDSNQVWQHLVPFSFFGRKLRVFSPELMLVALCIHSAQHHWAHLKMFADIAELLYQSPQLNWRIVDDLVADSHAKRSMLVALALVRSCQNAELPPHVIDEIRRDPHVSEIASAIYSKIWPSPHDPTPVQTDFRWLLFRSRGERLPDRLRYLCAVALRPTLADFQTLGLPRQLEWLYFALRPARVVLRRLRSQKPS